MVEGARARGAQERFEFSEGLLNRTEIWTVRRPKAERGANSLNPQAHLGLLVDRQVVEDHDIARAWCGREHLVHVRKDTAIVGRAIEDRWREEAVQGQPHHDGVGLSLAARRVIAEPFAAGAAPIATQQVGRAPIFIERDGRPDVAGDTGTAAGPPPVHMKFERCELKGPQIFPPPSVKPWSGERNGPSFAPKSLPCKTLPITEPDIVTRILAMGDAYPTPVLGFLNSLPVNWFPEKTGGEGDAPQAGPTL